MLDSTSASAAIKLLAFGPNPALQKVLQFDGPLGLGGVNRATGQDQYVGGKGQGVALALHRWAPGSSSIAHFLGGDTGTYVSDSMGQAGVHQLTQPCAAPTRVCTTLLDDGGRSTELIEPSGTISPAELDGLLTQLTVLDEYSGIAFCGTTPPGASALYAEAAARCGRNTLLMVDAFKEADVRAVLDSGRVDVLKLNVDEVKVLTSAATADEAAASLLRGPEAPLRRPGALLALTDGPKSARCDRSKRDWFRRLALRHLTMPVRGPRPWSLPP